MSAKLNFTEALENQKLAHELIVRKLRISYVVQAVESFTIDDLRAMHRRIHRGKGPSSGPSSKIQSIPTNRESMIYLSAFASLYLKASALDNYRNSLDAWAVITAWDLFHARYPDALRFRRPFGTVRPANITEAWILAQALRDGQACLRHCRECHGEYLAIEGCKIPPACQYCALGFAKRRGVKDDAAERPVAGGEQPGIPGETASIDSPERVLDSGFD